MYTSINFRYFPGVFKNFCHSGNFKELLSGNFDDAFLAISIMLSGKFTDPQSFLAIYQVPRTDQYTLSNINKTGIKLYNKKQKSYALSDYVRKKQTETTTIKALSRFISSK